MQHSKKNPVRELQCKCSERQLGLSLVELMIAIALGLLLTVGVVQIYLSGSATYRQTQGAAHAQESTRFVSSILTPDIRSAGTFGCLAMMNRPLSQVVENRLNGGLIVPIDRPVQGWEYNNTGPGDNVTLSATISTPGAGNWSSGLGGGNLPAALAGSVITNSDVIITNAMSSLDVDVDAGNPPNGNTINLNGPSGVAANGIILATTGNCSEGELFQKTNAANSSSITIAGGNVAPGNNSNNFNLTYEAQTRVYEFTAMAYYVGEGASGEPALFRQLMTPPSAPQELVSGVETLQILYGVDTGGTNAADDYLPADQVGNWTRVVSIRFATLARSQDEVLTAENTRSFNLLGSEVAQANDGDRRARIASAGTAALRGIMQ